MKKILKIANISLFFLGISFMAYFVIAGSYIDEDGFVVEEFAFWALGVWMVILSLAGFLIWGIVTYFRHKQLRG